MQKKTNQLLENRVKKIYQEILSEENPNYRKQADLKYSERNDMLIRRTKQLFDSKYSQELNNILNEVLDDLRQRLSVKDIISGRTATRDVQVIRNQLKKSIFEFMKTWTE